jgi:predicted aspartyl protease
LARLLRIFAGVLLCAGLCTADDVPHKVPFKLHQKFLMVVQGSIGVKQRLNFIVDTGTAPSIIHRRLARALRLTGEKDRLFTANRTLKVQQLVLPAFEMGPIRAEKLSVLVYDLASLERDFGIRIDGILGLDAFGAQSFTIDFVSNELVFGPNETSEGVTFENAMPFLIVPMKVQGRSLRLLVDTGAEHLVLFGDQPFPEFSSKSKKQTLSNLGSQLAMRPVRLPELRLGDTDFGTQQALVERDCRRVPACSVLGTDGLLPLASLGLRQVHFDFKHGRIGWRR